MSEPAFDIAAREALVLGQPARIGPVPEHEFTPEARAVRDMVNIAVGAPPVSFVPGFNATLLRHPGIFQHFFAFGAHLMGSGKLAPRDREMAILRTGWLCQAPFEWGEHVTIAKRNGLTSEEIERITEGSTAPGWTEHERAILSATEELHFTAMISDATWAALARTLNEQQLIELPVIVGNYHTVSYLQNALRVPLHEDNAGFAAR